MGYVLARDYWREPRGHYEIRVTLASTAPVNVEVWNATGDALLARRIVPATAALNTVTLVANADHVFPHRVYRGWGPFQAAFAAPLPGNRLEVRVWEPAGDHVTVHQIRVERVG